MNKNVGLFFGTFDPLHNGHIAIAKYFLNELNLDQIWIVITPISPFKQANKLTKWCVRLSVQVKSQTFTNLDFQEIPKSPLGDNNIHRHRY